MSGKEQTPRNESDPGGLEGRQVAGLISEAVRAGDVAAVASIAHNQTVFSPVEVVEYMDAACRLETDHSQTGRWYSALSNYVDALELDSMSLFDRESIAMSASRALFYGTVRNPRLARRRLAPESWQLESFEPLLDPSHLQVIQAHSLYRHALEYTTGRDGDRPVNLQVARDMVYRNTSGVQRVAMLTALDGAVFARADYMARHTIGHIRLGEARQLITDHASADEPRQAMYAAFDKHVFDCAKHHLTGPLAQLTPDASMISRAAIARYASTPERVRAMYQRLGLVVQLDQPRSTA